MPEIERALGGTFLGRWRRMTSHEAIGCNSLQPIAGWRIALKRSERFFGSASYAFIVLDADFPYSDPRCAVPEAPPDFQWPHVEPGGVLCLPKLARDASPADRVLETWNNAVRLGTYSEDVKKKEFVREFGAYWNRLRTPRSYVVYSLVTPGGGSRDIFYYRHWQAGAYVFADDPRQLRSWLEHRGIRVAHKEILRSVLGVVKEPPSPPDFPKVGRDILSTIAAEELDRLVIAGEPLPLLLEVFTPTGSTFAGVVVTSPRKAEVLKGYRSLKQVPIGNLRAAIWGRPIERSPVERVDASWIHGRDHDSEFDTLRGKRVLIVGCGAIGAAVARLLVQAGVGTLVLIDADSLTPANTSRHMLGFEWVRQNKANATKAALEKQFPDLVAVTAYDKPVQQVLGATIKAGDIDLIASAGIELEGDIAIANWRRMIANPPPHLCTWTEEFALAGHALAILNDADLTAQFSSDGTPKVVATQWPETIQTLIAEAGCGNMFQPHGAVALSAVVMLATSLTLDVLLGHVTRSKAKLWLGDRDGVLAKGGTPNTIFDRSYTIVEYPLIRH